ncbi:hypothetical protein BGX28_002144 [Mortierella sp. GBA30]|nr:hypothetical protein BGX28_002144 [Mortierella sp. GBA30]
MSGKQKQTNSLDPSLEHYQYLIASHLLSCLSTALLHCVFGAWYTSQHPRKAFAPALIESTFSIANFLNGLVAILAGVVANISVTLILAGLLISSSWEESYGDSKTNVHGSVLKSMLERPVVLKNDGNILSLGFAQTVFECCMYTFVLLYTPALETTVKRSEGSRTKELFPLGYLFSAMMFCTMLGSIEFKIMSGKGVATEKLLSIALCISGASFCIITLNAYNLSSFLYS